AVADWLGNIRAEIAKEPGRRGGKPLKAIPDVVLPWRGWSDALRDDVAADEAQRRQHWGPAFVMAPKYPVRHIQGYRYPKPVEGQRIRAEMPANHHRHAAE